MKSVAKYTFFSKMGGQGKKLSHRGLLPMKRGIETGYLGKLGRFFQQSADRGEIMRLMQGGSWQSSFLFIAYAVLWAR